MDDPFDPYHKWLGIPPKDQPPHHYRLLGLELFEADLDVIEHASDQRMHHVRSLATGKHSELSQRLLNEISAARVCLLNPQRKAAYDAQLRGQQDKPVATPIIVSQPRPRRRAPALTRMWGLIAAGVATPLVILAVMALRGSPPPANINQPNNRPSAPTTATIASSTPSAPVTTPVASTKGVDPIQRSLEASVGMMTDKFALCHTMKLTEFVQFVESLRKSNYRPIRARPFVVQDTVLVAAIWTHDELLWHFASGLTPEELKEENERQASQGLVPVDVAAWQGGADPPLCLGVWAGTGARPQDFEMYAAASPPGKSAKYKEITDRGFRPSARQHFLATDGKVYDSMLFSKHRRAYYTAHGGKGYYESRMEEDRFQIDGGVSLWNRDGNVEPMYYGIWETSTRRNSVERHGLPPEEHLKQCQELAAEGRLPAAIGVAYLSANQTWVTASVWH